VENTLKLYKYIGSKAKMLYLFETELKSSPKSSSENKETKATAPFELWAGWF